MTGGKLAALVAFTTVTHMTAVAVERPHFDSYQNEQIKTWATVTLKPAPGD